MKKTRRQTGATPADDHKHDQAHLQHDDDNGVGARNPFVHSR